MLLRLQNVILEMVAKGEALKATTDRLCTEVEAIAPGTVCSVLAVDRGAFCIRYLALLCRRVIRTRLRASRSGRTLGRAAQPPIEAPPSL